MHDVVNRAAEPAIDRFLDGVRVAIEPRAEAAGLAGVLDGGGLVVDIAPTTCGSATSASWASGGRLTWPGIQAYVRWRARGPEGAGLCRWGRLPALWVRPVW